VRRCHVTPCPEGGATEQLHAYSAALIVRQHFPPRQESANHTVADGGDEPNGGSTRPLATTYEQVGWFSAVMSC